MKKFRLLAVITAMAMLLTSCEMFSEGGGLSGNKVQLKAYTEAQVRTTMNENYEVIWSTNDKIVVFGVNSGDDAEGKTFSLISGAGTTEGTFEGELSKEFTDICAFYPSTTFYGMSAEALAYVITLPTNAIFAEKNFIDGANPMVAYGTQETGLQFKNICGIIEFQIKGEGDISQIEIISNGQLLSGNVGVSPVDQSIFILDGAPAYAQINALLDEPLTLSPNEARSIYAIVPPNTYRGMTVRTTSTDGVVTTHTTADDIVIERSKITPVSSFEHTQAETKPAVKISYHEDRSDFQVVRMSLTLNSEAGGGYYFITSETRYNNAISQGKSDHDLVASGTTFTESISNARLTAYNYLGENIHILAAAYDKEGKLNENIEHLVITPKTEVPEDSSLSIDISSYNIASSQTEFTFSSNVTSGRILTFMCSEEEYSELPDIAASLYSAVGHTGNIDISSSSTLSYYGLEPGKSYKLFYRIGCGDINNNGTYASYSPMVEYSFTIPEYSMSDIKVNISTNSIQEWSASFNISATSTVSQYKYICTKNSSYQYVEHEIDSYGTSLDGNTTTLEIGELTELTEYTLYVIAYDADGVYGQLSSINFTTTAIQPVQSAEYNKFLGEYTFSSTNGRYNNDARTVTIAQGVEGKTFLVSGLLNPAAKANAQGVDDTITAKFDAATGQIILSGKIANVGNLSSMDIYIGSFSGSYMLPMGTLYATYNGGVLNFSCDGDGTGVVFTGLIFYESSNGSYNRGSIDFYTDLVLRKKASGDDTSTNSTENFQRKDESHTDWL